MSSVQLKIAPLFCAAVGVALVTGVVGLSLSGAAHAEGSRNLYPAGVESIPGAGRGNLDVSDPSSSYLNVIRRRGFIYVYAQAGERILVGSRNRTADGIGVIQIYNPQIDGFGPRGAEVLPATAAFTCTSGTTGLIETRSQELAGPRAVSGGGNSAGYVPCAYNAPQTGIYGVNFTGGSGTAGPNGVIDPPAISNATVSAWDVTVRANDTTTTDINGRVFTFAWTLFTGGNGAGRRLFQDLYYVTLDGYRYRQTLRGIDPNGGTFFANSLGFLDQGEPLYKNIRGLDAIVNTGIPAGVTVQQAQFPIFVSDIASSGIAPEVERVLAALNIPLVPMPPQVNDFQFVHPPTGGDTAYVGQGGTFNFTVTDTISFEIVISRDGVNFDPALPTNRVLTGQSGTGAYSVVWDGRDNAGNNFPAGDGYRFRLEGRNGEAHFPFTDVEGNLNGGPTLTKLNGNIQDSLVYYDDRGYVTRGGTSVGELNGHICGAGSLLEQPVPNVSLIGVDSSNGNLNGTGRYYRSWQNAGNLNADCSTGSGGVQGYGDTKGLNLWTYQSTTPQSSTLNIIDFADVITTVQAPASALPGAAVLVNLGFGNVGSINAASVGYSVQLPGGLSGVSCTGGSCAYNATTGLVTITGLPASLSPAQFQNLSLSYIAPAAGSVPVTASITTTTDQGPNLAVDTASSVTLIGGSNEADVRTRVLEPSNAVAGATVSVGIEYANVGGSLAEGLVYALQLPAGLSGVSCTAGISCSYNALTGAVSVSGLPSSLVAGAAAPAFQLQYNAPASGSVLVQSVISTTSPESNTANNTDSRVSTVIGTQTVDVDAFVIAPATVAPGSLITANVAFQNVGSSSFSGAIYALQLPPGLTGVSCVAPAVCTYDAVSGAVSVSGVSGNLDAGALVSFALRYNAPLAGVVPVTATATLVGDVNPANNTSTTSTTVVTAGSGVDVVTSVSAPATAAPGSTVNAPVSYSNLGPDPAEGLQYGLTLPPGLTSVACVGSGASCSYNAVTGVVTVSGGPSTLASGASFGFTLSYVEPGTGTVTVESTISTTTPEANLSNNTAQSSTLIVAGATADVTTAVSAPAMASLSSLVNVQASFSNVGVNNAENVGYRIQLSTGATSIEIRLAGALCSYDAGTGVVSGCGLPGTLVPGQGVLLDVSYVSPAVASTITVTSTITTSTSQTNENNDTAAASTMVEGSPRLRVVKTGVAGPIDVNTATSTTYTLTVTNIGDGVTSGNIIINDELRNGLALTGFSGAGWSCTGPTSVVCTYSGASLPVNGATALQLTVSIAALTLDANNTARVSGGGDPVCLAPPAVLDPSDAQNCISTVTVGTVPVTLAYVKASVVDRLLTVDFMTVAEAGTAGFRVYGSRGHGSTRLLLAPMFAGKGSSLEPQDYRIQVPYADERYLWIEEVASDGLGTLYGPYAINSEHGERNPGDRIDWASIHSELRAAETARVAALRARTPGSHLEAELRVSESGWARVSYADLVAQGIDWAGREASSVELLLGSESVPLQYTGPALIGPGSTFEFLGLAVENSLYTRTRVYRLRPGSVAHPLSLQNGHPTGTPAVDWVRDAIVHAPDREYELSARDPDPYSAFRLSRLSSATVSRTESFSLDDLYLPPSGVPSNGGEGQDADRIGVQVWSSFDSPHHVRFLLNGTELGSLQFSGREARNFSVALPEGLLRRGANGLTLELIDTGSALDSINLESIRVSYRRQLQATGNRLSFSSLGGAGAGTGNDRVFADSFSIGGLSQCLPASACKSFQISGLSEPDVVVIRQRGNVVSRIGNVRMVAAGSQYRAEFASDPTPQDRYWVSAASVRVPVTVSPALPITDPLAGNAASYLIISHASFIDGLAPLIAARQSEGFSVRTLDVADLYRYYGRGSVDPEAIRLAIADAADRLGTRYVLLVGGDTRDYFNYTGNGSLSFLPTFYRQVGPVITYAPTDVPYADLDGDGAMDLALGRWPVRTAAELANLVNKTLRYSQAGHQNKVLLVSDRDQGNVRFNVQARLVPAGLGSGWQSSEIALQGFPGGVVAARSSLVQALNGGQALTVYMGHGAVLTWSIDGLLSSQLLGQGLFDNANRPTIAWTVGCYGTYFTQPAYNAVSHHLLGRSDSGAAAVFGASTLSEIASDIVWMNALSPRIRGQRLGDALKQAQRLLHAAGDQYRDVSLGVNLLGDPALRLREAD